MEIYKFTRDRVKKFNKIYRLLIELSNNELDEIYKNILYGYGLD